MPGTPTTRLTIPLPAGGDSVAIPADVRRVAERLDLVTVAYDQGALAVIQPGGALEATPSRRGWRYYATDATAWFWCDGATWLLEKATPLAVDYPAKLPAGLFAEQPARYRPDPVNAPALRWDLLWDGTRWVAAGTAPAWRGTQTADFTSLSLGDTFQTTITGGKFVVPFAGDWEFDLAVDVDQRDASKPFRPVDIFPAAASGNYLPAGEPALRWVVRSAAYESAYVTGTVRLSGVPVNTTIGIYFRCPASSATVGIYDRRIAGRPIRVSPNA